jgi:hypothetical protein
LRRPALQPIGLLNHRSVFEEDFTVKQVEWREALHFGITLMAAKNFSHVKVELCIDLYKAVKPPPHFVPASPLIHQYSEHDR